MEAPKEVQRSEYGLPGTPPPIRLIWRVGEHPQDGRAPEPLPAIAGLLEDPEFVEGGEPDWVLEGSREELREACLRFSEAEQADPRNRLDTYAHAYLPYESIKALSARLEGAEELPESLQIQLEAGPHVPPPEEGANESGPPNGPVAGSSKDFSSQQGYLGDAGGVDARWSWGVRGGRGEGVDLVDVERGWNPGHRDLTGRVQPLSGLPDIPHGTAVLGVVLAARDGRGVTGIAHGARARCEPAGVGALYNPEVAVWRAANYLHEGLVLAEVQVWGLDNRWLPLEAGDLGWAVIRYAVLGDLHVVEAAANGRTRLVGIRDSGAIMVGSGDPVTHLRLSHSNYGDRVDLQGWGRAVVTSGGANSSPRWRNLTPDAPHDECYTRSFNGTSSAAAIVAGAVACTSGVARAHSIDLPPAELRDLLIRTGEHPADDGGEPIGPLPNLRRALTTLAQENGISLQQPAP